MRLIERIALAAGITVVAVTAIYRYLLDDEQRDALHDLSTSVLDATHEVTDSLSTLKPEGTTRAEEAAKMEANRERTKAQWEALGY